uniref:NADH dehydrogenase [ubiquinone] 1 alpha subcomplex assembly factor 4 n=1 Tax=Glossina pallidipes TaxID=7398 RepID=A0A1A9ZPN9_GLOPL
MGQIASRVVRKINRFNVENRAHRFLERDNPAPAPKYESNLRDMERTMELDPTFLEKLTKKDLELDQRLKNVYVTSNEPKKVTVGRCTLKQALEFITNHQSDPEKWTAQKIADDYKMKPKLVEHILHHFKTYNVFISDQNSKEAVLTQAKRKLLTDTSKSQSDQNSFT